VHRDADINASGRHFLALHLAALSLVCGEMAAFLLRSGANAATPNSLGRTPLMLASSSGQIRSSWVWYMYSYGIREDGCLGIGMSLEGRLCTGLHWGAVRRWYGHSFLLEPTLLSWTWGRGTPRTAARSERRTLECVAVFDVSMHHIELSQGSRR
jgi:hypothetical protein